MSCIGWATEKDPEIHSLYAVKLLEPGWTEHVSEAEFRYIRENLRSNSGLRGRWRRAGYNIRRLRSLREHFPVREDSITLPRIKAP